MKPAYSKFDARRNISKNVQDARQLLKHHKQVPKASSTQDARFKIRAKKFQPLKQEILKIKSTASNQGASSLPGRTILNRTPAAPTRTQAHSSFKPKNKLPSRSGVVSIENGKRKLTEKVTLHHTGLKVAVRNELAVPNEKRRPPARLQKNELPLKITLNNPSAMKKQLPPFEAYKPKLSRHDHLPVDRQRRRRENHPYSVSDLVTRSPSSSSNSYPTTSTYSRHMQPEAQHMRPMSSQLGLMVPSGYDSSHEPQMTPMLADFSPLEGTKIIVSNLHPVVVEDDILELFSVVGPVRRARMVGMCKAEVVFVKKEDAIRAYQKYNNRDLDGQPMMMKLMLHEGNPPNQISYSWMNDIGRRKARGPGTLEIDPIVLQRSLFKSTSAGPTSSPVVFTVKI